MALPTSRRLINERFSQKGRVIAAMVLIGAAFCGFPGRLADAAEELQPSFFGSMEIRSENLKPFTKWRTALERYSAETARERAGTCQSRMFNVCHYEELQRFLDGIGGKDRWDQLVEINRYMNTRRYITDPRNWGVPDYWATPGEFMTKFGDCEDYAIAKFLSLKRLGWTDDELRIAAVKDLNLKVGHAILIVYHAGKTWVLDNQIKRVVEAESIRHYQPVYSINETSWWRHRS
jgi:predicted transglutaminase-like cysteine proteinase